MSRIETGGLDYFEELEFSRERPLSDLDEARLLLRRLDFLGYAAMREGDEKAASDGEGDVAFDEAMLLAIQLGFRPRRRRQRTPSESAAEQRELAEAREDLLWLKSERAQKTNSFKSPGAARAAAREAFRATFGREPRDPPDWVGKAAKKVLEMRQLESAELAQRFRDQLANLPILEEKKQARTIADWRRNADLPPKRPRRDSEQPAPQSGFDARAFERRVADGRAARRQHEA